MSNEVLFPVLLDRIDRLEEQLVKTNLLLTYLAKDSKTYKNEMIRKELYEMSEKVKKGQAH